MLPQLRCETQPDSECLAIRLKSTTQHEMESGDAKKAFAQTHSVLWNYSQCPGERQHL